MLEGITNKISGWNDSRKEKKEQTTRFEKEYMDVYNEHFETERIKFLKKKALEDAKLKAQGKDVEGEKKRGYQKLGKAMGKALVKESKNWGKAGTGKNKGKGILDALDSVVESPKGSSKKSKRDSIWDVTLE